MAPCRRWRGRRNGPGRLEPGCATVDGRARPSGACPARRRRGPGGGRVSTEHLRALGDCVRRHPDLAVEHEDALARAGRGDERRDVPSWRPATGSRRRPTPPTPDLGEPEPAPNEQVSRLHASRTFEGWLRVDGYFAPHDADLVEAALDAGVDRALRDARDGDPSVAGRPVSALRAAALVDLAAQSMRQEPSDASVPDRYRVAVVVRHGQPTVPAEAACDADCLPGRPRRRR